VERAETDVIRTSGQQLVVFMTSTLQKLAAGVVGGAVAA
jgi:hypothetical protein